MAVTQTAQACDLVIFGAKGDLARRKLLPSLYQLEKAGQIHPDTRILGVGRADCFARILEQICRQLGIVSGIVKRVHVNSSVFPALLYDVRIYLVNHDMVMTCSV